MATKKSKKEVKKQEVSRIEVNGNIIITFDDGSVQIIPAPINLTKEQAEEVFGSSEEDDDEDEEDSDDEDEDDESDDEDESDEDDEEEDDDSDDEDSDEDEDDDEEELTGEDLAEMDFEELEDVCEDKELETDPDDYEEKDIEKLRKAIAKELGITLPAKKETKAKGKKGKK